MLKRDQGTPDHNSTDGYPKLSAQPIHLAHWPCPAYVPVSQLIYAAFRSKAKGLLPSSGMLAPRIIKPVDILEYSSLCLASCFPSVVPDQLSLD